jgi:hypothetical protein
VLFRSNNKDSNSYLEKNINTEKFEKFKQRFSLLLTNEKFKVLWYFDDTVFGKGDDGGAIVVKGEHVYLLFANISDKLNIFEIINLKNIDQLVHKTFDFVFDVNPYKSFLSSGITITSGASQTLASSVNISIRDKYIVSGLVYLWSKINSYK